jgi:hypothetical protein
MIGQEGLAGKWPIKNVVDYEIEDLLEGDVHHAFIDYHEYLFDQVQELLKLEPMSDSDIQLARMTVDILRLGIIGVLKKTLFSQQIEQQVWRLDDGTEQEGLL